MGVDGHVAERERFDGLTVDGVHVAVLVPADIVDHKVADPTCWQRFGRLGKRERQLIVATEDQQPVVAFGEQFVHVSEPSEGSRHRWPVETGDEPRVMEVFGTVPGVVLAERDAAAIMQVRAEQWQFCLTDFDGSLIDREDGGVPIELHVRDDADAVIGRIGSEHVRDVDRDGLRLATGEAHERTNLTPLALRIDGLK